MNYLIVDNKGKLIFYPQKFAKYFIEKYYIYSCEGRIYIYENGNYQFTSDSTLTSIIRNTINNDFCKTLWISDSVKAIKDLAHIKIDDFNKIFNNYKNIINVKNGLLYLNKDGTITLKQHDPKIKTTIQLDVNYKENYKLNHWNMFLNTSLKSDEERIFLQEIMGYSYLNYINGNAQNMYFFHGEGGNGKGIIFDINESILGKNYLQMNETKVINTDQNNQFFGFQFDNKLNVQIRETNYHFKNLTFLKDLVCGSISQSEKKGSMEIVDIKFNGKVWVSTNDKIKILDTTIGTKRRAKFLLINEKIEKKIGNLDELLENEKDDIFSWAIDGLIEFIKNDYNHRLPQSHFKLFDDYMTHSNNFLSFIKSYISLTPSENLLKELRGISKENVFELFKNEYGNIYTNKKDFFNKFENELFNELKYKMKPRRFRVIDVFTRYEINVHSYIGIYYNIDKDVEIDENEEELNYIKDEKDGKNLENVLPFDSKKASK